MQKLITIAMLVMVSLSAQADDRRARRDREHHDYIIERQQSYQVQGPPTDRLIIGKRQIDGYRQRDGGHIWFEGNSVVGVTR
jgi:hypothetical protein